MLDKISSIAMMIISIAYIAYLLISYEMNKFKKTSIFVYDIIAEIYFVLQIIVDILNKNWSLVACNSAFMLLMFSNIYSFISTNKDELSDSRLADKSEGVSSDKNIKE